MTPRGEPRTCARRKGSASPPAAPLAPAAEPRFVTDRQGWPKERGERSQVGHPRRCGPRIHCGSVLSQTCHTDSSDPRTLVDSGGQSYRGQRLARTAVDPASCTCNRAAADRCHQRVVPVAPAVSLRRLSRRPTVRSPSTRAGTHWASSSVAAVWRRSYRRVGRTPAPAEQRLVCPGVRAVIDHGEPQAAPEPIIARSVGRARGWRRRSGQPARDSLYRIAPRRYARRRGSHCAVRIRARPRYRVADPAFIAAIRRGAAGPGSSFDPHPSPVVRRPARRSSSPSAQTVRGQRSRGVWPRGCSTIGCANGYA